MKLSNHISNLIRKKRSGYLASAAIALLACGATSCSMINEDLDPCAPAPRHYTTVDFIYDYNMSGALTGEYEDWFDDHVGSVYLYIFNKEGIYIDRREEHKFGEGHKNFTMTFSDNELIPGETYNFVAVAQGNPLGKVEDEDYKWFEMVNEMELNKSRISDYILRLYRDTNHDGFAEVGVINYKDQYGKTQQMIDTLWTTKPDEVQTVTIKKAPYIQSVEQQPDVVTNVTVPMMRITNSVKVTMHGTLFTENTDKDDYHVIIYFPNGNGTVDFTGDISQSTQSLYYQSLVKEVSPYTPSNKEIVTRGPNTRDGEENITYALKSRFGVSRLMAGDESRLRLYSKDDMENPIIDIPFTDYLTKYLNDPAFGYDDQEFLDREYDFEIELAVDSNEKLQYLQLSCHILSWARRIYFYDL